MMRKILLAATLLGFVNLHSQISLEHSYDNSTSNSVLYSNYSFSFNTENSTYYYYFSSSDNSIKIYNENHTFYKSVLLPAAASGYISIYAPSDKLFNDDALIEFIVMIGATNQMYLINENGSVINNLGERNRANVIKTANGDFKLVASKDDGRVIDVYNLPGALSANQFNLLTKASLFPNPADSIINIVIPDSVQKNSDVKIYNISGTEVLTQKNLSNSSKISLDISALSSGIYIYKIGEFTGKFIKE